MEFFDTNLRVVVMTTRHGKRKAVMKAISIIPMMMTMFSLSHLPKVRPVHLK